MTCWNATQLSTKKEEYDNQNQAKLLLRKLDKKSSDRCTIETKKNVI